MPKQVILFQGTAEELLRLCKDIRENMAEDILLADMFK